MLDRSTQILGIAALGTLSAVAYATYKASCYEMPSYQPGVMIYPLADADVWNKYPDENYGTINTISVVSVDEGGGHYNIAFGLLKFDLFGKSYLNGVDLHLYIYENRLNTDCTLWFTRLSRTWNEMEVTWNNVSQYRYPSSQDVYFNIFTSDTGWLVFRFTPDLLPHVMDGDYFSVLLYLEPSEGDGDFDLGGIGMDAREGVRKPYITLV